jgi:hypothetical protein
MLLLVFVGKIGLIVLYSFSEPVMMDIDEARRYLRCGVVALMSLIVYEATLLEV